MRINLLVAVSSLAASCAYAFPVDCDHNPRALAFAAEHADAGDTLLVSGTCQGGLTISRSLTLIGRAGAGISGGSDEARDAVQVIGPARVTIKNLTIQQGVNGVHGLSGAQLTIINSTEMSNSQDGILLEGQSAATLSGGGVKANGLNGLDAEATSSVILQGAFYANNNAVFGININGASSLTLTQAQLLASGNTLGIQVGTSAAAFIADSTSSITVQGNFSTGLTIVSGSHMVAFGGTINAMNNGFHGISVDSKAGFDLDAAAQVTSSGNALDGVHLEETSVMTIFNTTAFSGAPGVTTLNVAGNGQNGISILTGSNVTMIHQAAINSNGNTAFGIFDDNGSGLTLIGSNITGNHAKDVLVNFGSRADISTSVVGTFTCDASALVRGDTAHSCPQ